MCVRACVRACDIVCMTLYVCMYVCMDVCEAGLTFIVILVHVCLILLKSHLTLLC